MLSLCNEWRIKQHYPSLSAATAKGSDGNQMQLFSLLIVLLLRIASQQDSSDPLKIARRTKEVYGAGARDGDGDGDGDLVQGWE